ncbi:MAG: CPBP family intramembrane glutamic endopeptidase [Halobacteriales archaeon]
MISALGLPTQEGIEPSTLLVGLIGAVTAGITEEVLFRGYPIERIIDGGFPPLAAGAATWALFTLAHAPTYPLGNVVQLALVALVFTAAYIRLRSLFPVMVGHIVIDIVGVLAYVFT